MNLHFLIPLTLLSVAVGEYKREEPPNCAVYTLISDGTMAGFSSRQWFENHIKLGRKSLKAIAAEGRKFVAFLKEWYGLDVYVEDDVLSGIKPAPLFFQTRKLRFIFKVSANPEVNNFRIYSAARGSKIRQFYEPIRANQYIVETKNAFTVTRGRNKGMIIPARSRIYYRDFFIDLGDQAHPLLFHLEDRVPSRILDIPLGKVPRLTGFDATEGTYVLFNEYVTSPSNPELQAGVARGILPVYGDGVNVGRMVIAFPCGPLKKP